MSDMAEPSDQLRSFLAERDVACPGCGYNLRGLTGDRCPECNEELRLQVGLVEPKMGTLVVSMVGLATGWGFCAFVSAWGFFFGARTKELLPLVVGVVALGLGLAGVWRGRGRLRRLPRGSRIAVAVACWVVSVLFTGWFIAQVR